MTASNNELSKVVVKEESSNEFILNNITDSDLDKALSKLNAEQRNCIEHFYFKKMRYNKVAEVLNMDLKRVKTNLQNGKRMLKNYLLKNRNHENR